MLRATGADHSTRAAKGQTIYHVAVEKDAVLPLIMFSKWMDINTKNDAGETPLIYACDLKYRSSY